MLGLHGQSGPTNWDEAMKDGAFWNTSNKYVTGDFGRENDERIRKDIGRTELVISHCRTHLTCCELQHLVRQNARWRGMQDPCPLGPAKQGFPEPTSLASSNMRRTHSISCTWLAWYTGIYMIPNNSSSILILWYQITWGTQGHRAILVAQAAWDTVASPCLAGRILRVAALVDGSMLAKMLKVGLAGLTRFCLLGPECAPKDSSWRV